MVDFPMIFKVPISGTLSSYWNCLVGEVRSNLAVVLSQKALSTFSIQNEEDKRQRWQNYRFAGAHIFPGSSHLAC